MTERVAMAAVVPSSPGQAEVQAVFSDGAVSLHTRSLKYGKVSQAWEASSPLLPGIADLKAW